MELVEEVSLLEHIKNNINLDDMKLNRKNKLNFYGWFIQKIPQDRWVVFSQKSHVCLHKNLSENITPRPYLPENGCSYSFKDKLQALLALKTFFKDVKDGKHDNLCWI